MQQEDPPGERDATGSTGGGPVQELKPFRPKRWCPKCAQHALVRERTPGYLRALRVVGIRLGRYECTACGSRLTLKRTRK